jgi:hypothetical protein
MREGKVGAFILHRYEAYPYILNKSAFNSPNEPMILIYKTVGCINPDSKSQFSIVKTAVNLGDCIFVYEGDEENYAEYFI